MLLIPLNGMVSDTAQWILIGTSVAVLFVCAYGIGANKRRSGGS
ncbi:hypothetical protein [Saccharopolyspora erythraea]|nr:hypothetical protein [Saccharopolyspora erythraea]